ncbi:TPA: hypothetical protein KRH38_003211 [Clostridioides difficile]|uniref:beta barrel domain-containing protein n=1 Tax=Clostridioides difficile TaxID=1496 RepID=UPI001C19B7B0|nr:hypothetical protein [Clostridioides difficile]
MDELKKGQTVYLKYADYGRNKSGNLKDLYTEGIIEIVGRKYLTVTVKGFSYKFDRYSLAQVTNYAQDYFLYLSEKDLLDEIEIDSILTDLRNKIGVYNYSKCKLNIDQLRRIKKIMDENKDIDNSNLITQE